MSSAAPSPVHPLHETSAAAQRATRLPKVSTGRGRETGSLPIGVLLSADGALDSAGTGALAQVGTGTLPPAWGQPHSSSAPLPRREPRGPGRGARDLGPSPARPLPRRRDLRAGSRPAADGGSAGSPAGSWAPQTYPERGRSTLDAESTSLPPGVVRLDENGDPIGDVELPKGFAHDSTRVFAPRHDRSLLLTNPNGIGRISRLMRPVGDGPTTGSLDIDADLFTPASERLARQTPPQGIAARHTPSAGLALGGVPEVLGADADGAPAAYPRRRDLRRRGGSAVVAPPPPIAPAGMAFLPAQSGPAPVSGEIPIGAGLPRRRDLRHGSGAEEFGPADEPVVERSGTERTGAIAVGVARAAVMTMLVGVGYAVVSGHQLNLDTSSDATSAPEQAEAMLAGPPVSSPSQSASVAKSDWDARSEVAAAKTAAAKMQAIRLAAAQAAAARVQAARAAAAARAHAIAEATRDAQRNPKAIAKLLAAQRGWGSTQFTCLDLLWTRESGWDYRATNASSGAYGIPQSLPGSKMGSVAGDWRTNPVTQIKWGLSYIASVYGTPCGAWAHSQRTGWY